MPDLKSEKIYLTKHLLFFEKFLLKKRKEILIILKEFLINKNIEDVLDIGSTEDTINVSSNFIIKNLGNYKDYKSISNQKIKSDFFSKKFHKSITEDFSDEDIKNMASDLVISNATIEHVGGLSNQIKMCRNIIKLSKKYFIIITPNRHHPLEFHTKIPFIHWFPKKIHRSILKIIGLKFFSFEENLNLLSKKDFEFIMRHLGQLDYNIKSINTFFIKSNLILLGKINE
jgi:hypothetical protein